MALVAWAPSAVPEHNRQGNRHGARQSVLMRTTKDDVVTMTSTPLNQDMPDSQVSENQRVEVIETPARDYPSHGSVTISLHHSESQSTTIQIAERTAESLRDQLNDLLAVAQPVVNSVPELDALPIGSVLLVTDKRIGSGASSWELFDDVLELRDSDGDLEAKAWASSAYKGEYTCESLWEIASQIIILHNPEVKP